MAMRECIMPKDINLVKIGDTFDAFRGGQPSTSYAPEFSITFTNIIN